jgi:branched-chain amino acid transport system permease protein
MFELTLQALYSGLLAGGSYALIAVGLALVFGTMRVINLAHGELVLLSAYIAYTAEVSYKLSPIAAIPFSIMVVCATAVLVNLLVNRIKSERALNSLILTYGIGVMITNGVLIIWKADIRTTRSAWLQEPVQFGSLYSMRGELLFFIVSLVLLAGVWWWLNKTWYGRAVRAVSSNREAAKLMGIDPQHTELVSFVIAGLLAAFAGVAIYSYGVVQPSLGAALTVKAFIITVLAGLGSIVGVLIGALLIGVVEALTTTFYSSAVQELTGMLLFLLVLFVLPNGLFGGWKKR